jgi:pyridoxal phosphate enzyme (YggS family)
MNVLIQVNVDNEAAKSGVSLEEVSQLASAIAQMPKLKLRGLMAIPSKTQDFDEQSLAFSRLHDCFTSLSTQYTDIDTLSMGMTSDLEAAIAQGSTMVRLGTAIFGPRETKNP